MAPDPFRWLRENLTPVPRGVDRVDPDLVVPAEVRPLLIKDNSDEPLWPQFQEFGKGRSGVTRETPDTWVARDNSGRVVGGAIVEPIGDTGYHAIDVAVEPRHRRYGFGSQLYAAIQAAGIDVEACSNASLHLGTMTELGYAFQVGRRRKALSSDTGPLAERLRETGIEGPDLQPGWIPPSIEETWRHRRQR